MSVVLGLWLLFSEASAEEDWSQLYVDIEENNLELQSLSQQLQAENLEFSMENRLGEAQINGRYLQPHQGVGANQVELLLSQGFDFPLVYSARAKQQELLQQKATQSFRLKRQEILWTAEQYLLELVYLHKKIEQERIRNHRAKQNVEHFEQLWKAEQIDRIAFNKSKLVWLHEQFVLKELLVEKEHLEVQLRELQSGMSLRFIPEAYASDVSLPSLAELWEAKKTEDLHLRLLEQEIAVADQRIRVASLQRFPELQLGYSLQGGTDNLYSGVYVGLSTPVGRNRDKLLIERLKHKQVELQKKERLLHEELFLDVHYGDHQLLVGKYEEYLRILESLDGEDVLAESLKQGEISFVEYHQELSFYREAVDHVLDMEWQLQKSKSALLKFKL